jgi:hypothetical protein
MHRLALASVLLLLASCAPPPGDEPATPPTTLAAPPSTVATGAAPAPGAPAPAAGGRSIGPNTRPVMLETLARERGNDRTMWLAISPGDPETAALKDEITALFQEAGWTVQTQTLTGLRLKPGLVLLLAEESPPPYTEVVVDAFETSGLEVKSASGYRAYADEMKQQNPEWPGIPMTAEQDMVLVLGPKPAA